MNNDISLTNPSNEMGSPEPAQVLDSGPCGLSLAAGSYRIAGDPAQLRHQLALTGRRAPELCNAGPVSSMRLRYFAYFLELGHKLD
jgi:hypothetical protein